MYADFESDYPYVVHDVSPAGDLVRVCSCSYRVVVRDQVPIGLMDDGDGGMLCLFNCPACRTTLSEEVKP
jgi:hypothetical protein